MEYQRLDPKTERWSDGRGSLEIELVRRGVVLERFRGHALAPVADVIIERLDRLIEAEGPILVFDDWEAATGYESEVRIRLTAWMRTRLLSIPQTHILVRSKILAMGITVGSLAAGATIRTYASRPDFEAALRRASGPAPRAKRPAAP